MAIRDKISKACAKKILFMTHAIDQMNSPERMISTDEVRDVVAGGELIEDYPDDPRGHSCLLSGETRENRTVHVVCAPREDYLAVITAYIPNPEKWENKLKERRK